MAATTEREEATMKQVKSLNDAVVGDMVVVKTSGRMDTFEELAEVTKITKNHLIAADRRFWKNGDNAGQKVGEVSRNWRTSYMQSSHYVRFPVDDDDTAEVAADMAEREEARRQRETAATAERDAKNARREARFEGTVDEYSKRLDELSQDEELDERITETAKVMSFTMRRSVWDIESNESDITLAIAGQTRDITRLGEQLEDDLSLWSMSNDEIPKLIAKREALIERAKEQIYIARRILGEKQEQTS